MATTLASERTGHPNGNTRPAASTSTSSFEILDSPTQAPDDVESRQQASEQTTVVSQSSSDWPKTDHQESKGAKPSPTRGGKLVTWNDNDPEEPKNWSSLKKWRVLLVTASGALCVTCNSSIVSSTFTATAEALGISDIVAILGLSLFVTGLGIGPLFLGPFSEAYGRRPIYLISLLAFTLLQFPVAFANNAPVWLVFRFLVGVSGSAFLSVAGGTCVDLFSPMDLMAPMIVYTTSPFLGPSLGPLIGNYIVQYSDWRWVWYTTIIWSFVQFLLVYFLAPETFGPVLLSQRAKALRKQDGQKQGIDNDKNSSETSHGDGQWYTDHERHLETMSFANTMRQTATKVPMLLITEPMLLMLCIWSALLLGILYLLFEAFPIVFTDQHGFTMGQVGLCFLGIAVGILIATSSAPYWHNLYRKRVMAKGGAAVPEERLPMCMLGAFLTVIGLFIFAFTSYPNVSPAGPIVGSIPFGTGTILIYSGVFTYTTSAYRPVAASAMAANSIVRSAWAAAFPLFATQMYTAMGTVGASALLAALNVLMIPIPFLLYKYGAKIRANSKYTS